MLKGKFVFHDTGESYRAGEIIETVLSDGICFIRFDCLPSADTPPVLPMEAIMIKSLVDRGDEGVPMWMFFETRADIDAWIGWLEDLSEAVPPISIVRQ